tara:strand:- start:3302 stop:4525 length:1224 start_codon:yes stop_codon:yes gene_type:complete
MLSENMQNEIEKSAQHMNMTVEEATEKYTAICAENNIEVSDSAGLGLWRNLAAQIMRRSKQTETTQSTGSNSLVKKCFGFFVALEAPRDMMSWNRNRAKEEYNRDADNGLNEGHVAVATENALGKWMISRYHDGEYQERMVNDLPAGAEEAHDGVMIIPLDNTKTYMNGGENRNYGKPLPVEQFRRSGVFYGSVDGADMKPYQFSYKNQGGIEFTPDCYDFVHFVGIPSEDGGSLYGMTMTTKNSLIRNDDLDPENSDYRDMGEVDFVNQLNLNFESHMVELVEIDRAHITRQTLPAKDRFVITSGTVCNMNMMPTSNGNRILNITDLNAEFDYDNESNMTTCWIPEHLGIDFGIGSTIVVVGRTSQRLIDGVADPVTINVASILVTEKRGSPVEVDTPVEESFDWF